MQIIKGEDRMNQHKKIAMLSATALLAALCFIGFQFIRIDIPVGAGKTAIHFGNTFCILAALMLGGVRGGLAGAIGMSLADLLSGYATSAPKTFLMKLLIGMIAGFFAHRMGHVKEHLENRKYVLKWSLIASIMAMVFNVIVDPIMSYLYKNYILGVSSDAAKILASWSAISTFINAITTIVFATMLFVSLSKKLKGLSIFK